MISNNGNINLLREQIDLNSDLISKLERMEIQYEENQSELDYANTTNADLNAAINLLNYELDECGRKLKTVSIERDRLSNQLSEQRVAFDLSNFNEDSSKMETTTLKDELSLKTDELRNILSRLNELNASLKQQRTEHEQAIAVMKPELATYRDLNSKLHSEIVALIKVSDSQRNDNVLLKDHITDLTKALDGFTVKLNSESAQKNIIAQKLQEKSMAAATFERELEKAVLVIEDLRADNEDETSLFRSRQSQEKMLSIELSRVTDERNALFADNKYLRGEIESAQCILSDQLQLRLQDRSNYEALLVASDENVQRAIDDSKHRLEDMTKRLLGEAQRGAAEEKRSRNEMMERCLAAEQSCAKLSQELLSAHQECERLAISSDVKDRYATETGISNRELHVKVEKESAARVGSLSLQLQEAHSSMAHRTAEHRAHVDSFIAQLSSYQGVIKEIKDDSWNLRSKVLSLESHLTRMESKKAKNRKALNGSLIDLDTEQKAVFRTLGKKNKCLSSDLSAAEQRAAEESSRCMYLTREISNLKLELFEARRGRN